MRTETCAMLILSVFLAVSFVKSCGQGKKYFYCKRTTEIREKRCPEVEAVSCARYTLRCACDGNHHRDSNGNCVKLNQCHSVIEENERNRQNAIIQKENVYNYTLQVIQSPLDLDLIYISTWTWMGTICQCLKSSFIENKTDGALRWVYCYANTEIVIRQGVTKHVMAKARQKIQFEVRKRKQGTTIQLKPRAGADLSFELEPDYEVLTAAPDCVLLKVGTNDQGKFYCMLWGLGGNHTKNDKECFEVHDRQCTREKTDVWSEGQQCIEHDNLVRDAQSKTQPTSVRRGRRKPQPVPAS